MKRIYDLKLVILTTLVVGCTIMPPRRQYIKEVKQQQVPKEILNSQWSLETVDNKVPDCILIIGFLDRGQLTIKFKGQLYDGDNLWYLVKDSVIEFHTRPLEKIAWTEDNCETNPSSFALDLMGDKKVKIINNKLTFDTYDKRKFIFRKA